MTTRIIYSRTQARMLLRTLGRSSTRPAYALSLLDRGALDAIKFYGVAVAADYMRDAGFTLRAALRLLQIAKKG